MRLGEGEPGWGLSAGFVTPQGHDLGRLYLVGLMVGAESEDGFEGWRIGCSRDLRRCRQGYEAADAEFCIDARELQAGALDGEVPGRLRMRGK